MFRRGFRDGKDDGLLVLRADVPCQVDGYSYQGGSNIAGNVGPTILKGGVCEIKNPEPRRACLMEIRPSFLFSFSEWGNELLHESISYRYR